MIYIDIWEDIDNDVDFMPVNKGTYNESHLSEKIYHLIDMKIKKKKAQKNKKKRKVKIDKNLLDEIRIHRNILVYDDDLNQIIKRIFVPDAPITKTDRLFLNVFYRKILRAKLEQDFLNKELSFGLVITGDYNYDIDRQIVETLKILRIICNFLQIKSTIDNAVLDVNKLYHKTFWYDITSKFIKLFGETKIVPVNDILFEDEPESILQIIMLLKIIFYTWSGSILELNSNNTLQIKPAIYVSKMLNYIA